MKFARGLGSGGAAVAAALLASGCSWIGLGGNDEAPAQTAARASAIQSSPSAEGTYGTVGSGVPLRPGDHIRVSSWREEGLTDEFIIDQDGTVVLPLLGSRQATGKPADQFRRELVEDYESRFRNHTVGVTILRRVSILGSVRTPGVYHVDPTMSISEAVALAGGADPEGKMDEVTIHRNGQEIESRLSQAAPLQEYVQSGDQIVVPKRNWFARNAALLIGSSISAATIIITQFF